MSDPRPTQRRWTADAKKKLDDLLEAGKTVVEIARVLQRTREAIYVRLQRRYQKTTYAVHPLAECNLRAK